MLPRLHTFQLPCILKAWRADRKACICLWLSMCPRKSIFSTQAAGCMLQFHCAHWAVGRIKAFLSASTIYGKQDSSPSPPISNLLQTRSSPTGGERKKRKGKTHHFASISSRNTGSPHSKKVLIKIQLDTPLSASLWHFAVLYLCFTPTYWEQSTLTSFVALLSVIICIRNPVPRVFTA